MENVENNVVVDTTTETVTDTETTTEEVTETNVDGADVETPVTFTEEEVTKKIQSAEDKLRTKYSKEIKELKAKIEELSPTKTEAELEIERRLAELEKSQAEVNAQKQFLELQNTLKGKGIDEKIATYLKDGVDIEEFATTFNSILSEKAKAKGFVPTEHPTGDNVTVEQFKNWSYDKRAELYQKNPALYEKLAKKAK